MGFAPKLHDYYRRTIDTVFEWDAAQPHPKHKRLHRNFLAALSVFTTATFNFGPRTVTFPHIDFGNLAWGWCAITALGWFDPNLGGHLILWDLKLISQQRRCYFPSNPRDAPARSHTTAIGN
jgi:hypothetical protein